MAALSILNMNWTRGTRELEIATELTELEAIGVRVSLAYTLQAEGQDEENRLIGNNIEADALHQLVEFLNSNTAHVSHNWQAKAEAQADDYADLIATQESARF